MVADTVVGFAFSIEEHRSLTVEDLAHDDVTGLVSKMSHVGCGVAPVFGFGTHGGTVSMRQFLPARTEEIGATFMRSEVEMRMFAITSTNKPIVVERNF